MGKIQRARPGASLLWLASVVRTDALLALLVAVSAFALYLRTLAPGLLGGDSGELQFAAWLAGLAHPTGYPLYLALGHLWSRLLPFGDPAWRMNLFSALWGALAVGLVYLLALRVLHAAAGVNAKPPCGTGDEKLTQRRQDAEAVGKIQRSFAPFAPLREASRAIFGAVLKDAGAIAHAGRDASAKPPCGTGGENLTPDPSPARRGEAAGAPPPSQGGGRGVGAIFTTASSDWNARLSALFAALAFAVTPTFWSQALIAEVYTLHAVFVAALLLSLVAWADRPVGRRTARGLCWIAALYGLSLTHHRTMLLLLPAIGVFLWWTGSASSGRRWPPRLRALPRILPIVATVCLPLLLYLYVPLRAGHSPYLRVAVSPAQTLELYQPTLAGFFQYVAGQVFQSSLSAPAQAAGRLLPATRLFVQEATWVGIGLGLLGLVELARRGRPLLALTGLSSLAIVAFNLFYGIGDIRVFYIPAFLIWALWMAVGVNAIGRRVRAGAWLTGVLALALPAWLLWTQLPSLDQSRNDQARAGWEALLAQPIPAAAILATNDRDEMMPLWYRQHVEGVRGDLTGLFPLIRPEPAWADVGMTVEQALRSGRPTFLIKPMPGLEVKFRLEPAAQIRGGTDAPIVRVIGPAAFLPAEQPASVVYADAIRLAGYDLRPAALKPGSPVTVTLHWQPLRRLDADYTTFVHLLDADGVKIAQSDRAPGGVYYPTSLWKPGETLVDVHNMTLSVSLGRSPHTIVVGLYTGTTGLRHLAAPQPAGMIAGPGD